MVGDDVLARLGGGDLVMVVLGDLVGEDLVVGNGSPSVAIASAEVFVVIRAVAADAGRGSGGVLVLLVLLALRLDLLARAGVEGALDVDLVAVRGDES